MNENIGEKRSHFDFWFSEFWVWGFRVLGFKGSGFKQTLAVRGELSMSKDMWDPSIGFAAYMVFVLTGYIEHLLASGLKSLKAAFKSRNPLKFQWSITSSSGPKSIEVENWHGHYEILRTCRCLDIKPVCAFSDGPFPLTSRAGHK